MAEDYAFVTHPILPIQFNMQTTTNSLFKFLCLAVAVSLASALQLNAPLPAPNFARLVINGTAIISWTAETGDHAAISLEI
ncbi:hypothetical protein BDQ12DRAFT_728503 [Crucibulum laeve]|uniref:Uncharacterized protein n=1 Tax=Crucibulum laeve TaxID=68775 RepID=A0A5C3LJZ6_9AGAR|nr:hypothetical protein BDQ12DRAFT_728503 [Crucibulum laeve]